ncbi:MAG TPA: PmoA family protein [bacterium]|nr:PmoA family protein [bacterium]HPP30267.1 PmoA family protein [bacterium]
MKEIVLINRANRDFSGSPVSIEWNEEEGAFVLSAGREKIYGQTEKRGDKVFLVFIPPDVKAGEEVKFSVKKAEDAPSIVKLSDNKKEGIVDVFINEQLFTSYNYSEKVVRPYLFPVVGPEGKVVLRTPASEGNPEKLDHIHHRGIWVAHGDVNGTDNWSELPGHGRTVHQMFIEIISGPVFGKIHALSNWVSNKGTKILEEERIIVFYNLPRESRIIDQRLILRASEKEVVFKDTKESGLLSIRVNPVMEERAGGFMVNSYGAKGEAECWGKRAEWCDYCGEIEGTRCGIAVFDYPHNFRYPTWWHIRNYGLYTANFFGLSDFTGDKSISGTYILPYRNELKLYHRIYIHSGYTEEAKVADRYLNFIYPPEIAARQE